MENPAEQLLDLLVQDKVDDLRLLINEFVNTLQWRDIVALLRKATQSIYEKHWLKANHVILTIFDCPELLGVDCDLFNELTSIRQPVNMRQASDFLFERMLKTIDAQLRDGGSTLFFNVERISSTKSALILSDLIQARNRETLFVLQEIDGTLPTLTKEWVDVMSLWKTGNGFRLLRARHLGKLIHINDYMEIRDRLAKEMNIEPRDISVECDRLRASGRSEFLRFSKTLEEFVTGLIASLGIRGTFDPYYKTWIDHEGLDEF
jgi:hypothetical protein